jgi:hypothetical protein
MVATRNNEGVGTSVAVGVELLTTTVAAPLVRVPAPSVTVQVAVMGPVVAYTWVTVCPIPEPPSPNAHENEYGGTPPTAAHSNKTICATLTLARLASAETVNEMISDEINETDPE